MHRSLALSTGLIAALLTPAVPAAAAEPAICHVGYRTHGDAWSFNGDIVITNTGPATLYGWTLKFSLPAGQLLRNGWEADFTVDGQDVTAESLDYNRVVARKNSVTVGFHAGGDLKHGRPAGFTVNDHPCTTS
jgi:hypothetical protein